MRKKIRELSGKWNAKWWVFKNKKMQFKLIYLDLVTQGYTVRELSKEISWRDMDWVVFS